MDKIYFRNKSKVILCQDCINILRVSLSNPTKNKIMEMYRNRFFNMSTNLKEYSPLVNMFFHSSYLSSVTMIYFC